MVSDLDLYRSANVLVKRYGADAPAYARQRADECRANGDERASTVWLGICAAAEDLLQDGPREGEFVN